MDKEWLWDLFETTGSVKAFMEYKGITASEERKNDDRNKGFDNQGSEGRRGE